MSQLRSVIEEMATPDDRFLTSEELAADIVELEYARQMIDVVVATKTKSLTARRGHEELGYPSPTALLTHQCRMSAGRAHQVVARANAQEKSPVAFAAWADGRISTDQSRYLFALADAVPDVFPAAEEHLVEVVEGLSAKDTAKAIEYWRHTVDGPGELGADTQMIRRGLSLSRTIGAMRRVDGWLTQPAGEALEAALDANMPPQATDDTRTPRQRRHDALENLSRDWLDHADTPDVGGEKPHIMVIADIPALQGVAGGTHETLDGDIFDVETLQQLSCDCSISRIILGPDSEVLDVGRKTRVWTAAQRKAIIARDRHCQGDGCTMKPRWCDIHHLTHWTHHQGPTSIENGILLCRWHHTQEHHKQTRHKRIKPKG